MSRKWIAGDALLALLIAELAVRAHHLERGACPESLADLVPGYLAAVPEDPFRPGPLVYRRKADGHSLYSVGEDGADDGGSPDRDILLAPSSEGEPR